MLGKLLTPFTTAAPIGVATRDLTVIVGSVLALLGLLGALSPEQVEEITKQVPEILAAVGALAAAATSIYRIFRKSSSDKAAEAARQIDQKVPPSDPVMIKTPRGVADIVVPGK